VRFRARRGDLEGATGCLMHGMFCAAHFLQDDSWSVQDWVCPDRARSVAQSLLIQGAALTGAWHREVTTKLKQRLGEQNIDKFLRPEEVAHNLLEKGGLRATAESVLRDDQFGHVWTTQGFP
jgi:hypothetical protein